MSDTKFAVGNVPWNKGMKGYNANVATQFKAGGRAPRWVPLGTEKFNSYGYLERKVAETGHRSTDWVPVHKLIWEEAHGPVPAGHLLAYRDGDKTNVALDNLELITQAERMRRNTMHRLPAPLREVIHLKSTLTRKINGLDRAAADPVEEHLVCAEQ